jgi:hypothetical protein
MKKYRITGAHGRFFWGWDGLLFPMAQLAMALALAVSGTRPAGAADPGSASEASSQAATAAPTLDQVLERYVQAVGGKAAIQKLTSRTMKGAVENPATGETGSLEIYRKAPNKEVSTLNIPSWGLSTRGYNGAAGWTFNPDSGPGDMSAMELAAMKLEADFYRDLRLKDLFPNMTLTGTEKVGDGEAYVVDAPQPGGSEKLYFDTRSGLLVRDDVPAETDGGKTTIQSILEDYREVDGVKLPFTVRQNSPDFDFVIKYTEIRHNVPIEDAKFEKPKS